jgi:hypothetical protein
VLLLLHTAVHCLVLLAVEYDDKRDAEDAVRGLDGSDGWRVEFARASGPKAKGSYAGGRGRDEVSTVQGGAGSWLGRAAQAHMRLA